MNDSWKDKKVLITGHTGFKGSWLSLILNNFGAKVYGLSLSQNNGTYDLLELNKIMESEFFIDISDKKENIETYVNKVNPEIIFHFAAQSLVPYAFENPFETIKTNLLGTFNILDISNNNKDISTVVIATTDKVYLNSEEWNKENSLIGGKEFYSISKVFTEISIENFINLYKRENLNISVVRSGNVIGGGERGERRLLTDLYNSVVNNEPLNIRRKDSIRPWQDILDSLSGYIKVAEYSQKMQKSEVFNLNSRNNNGFTVGQLIELYLEFWDKKIKINYLEESNLTESAELRLDSSKAEKVLGWKPKISLHESLNRIVKWEKTNLDEKALNLSKEYINDYFYE
jgi:CDP-glucose 4,6-dehydratase